MRRLNWNLKLGLVGLVLAACPGDDGGGDTAADTGDGTSSESGRTSQTTTGSASMTSASGSQSGTGTSETTTSTTDATATATTDGGMTTGGKDECAGLDRAACTEAEACAPIACRPYVMPPNPGTVQWCLEEAEFVGCQSADIGCGDAETVGCPGDTDQVYLCPDTCLPADFTQCEPPTQEPVETCPQG